MHVLFEILDQRTSLILKKMVEEQCLKHLALTILIVLSKIYNFAFTILYHLRECFLFIM